MDFGEAPKELFRRVDFEKNRVKDHIIDINHPLDVILKSPDRGHFQSEKDVCEVEVKIIVSGKSFFCKKSKQTFNSSHWPQVVER
jgi:hypothetical protein